MASRDGEDGVEGGAQGAGVDLNANVLSFFGGESEPVPVVGLLEDAVGDEGNRCGWLFEDFEAVVGFGLGNDGEVGDEDEIGGRWFVTVGLGEDGSEAGLVREGDGLFGFAGGALKGEFKFLAGLANRRVDRGGAGGLGDLQKVVGGIASLVGGLAHEDGVVAVGGKC